MSVIVINPKNDERIIYTEEIYKQAVREAADWQRALENAIDVPTKKSRKLTTEQVKEIRHKADAGVVLRELAEQYHVSAVAVWNIVHRLTYKAEAS